MSRHDRLFNLMPAVYRQLDAERGAMLRALFMAMETQYDALEKDIDRLYDNWFIETCATRLVPYLGELVGVQNLGPAASFDQQRAWVGNAIAFRRRKGVATVLQPVIWSATGWPVRTVESWEPSSDAVRVDIWRLRSFPVEGATPASIRLISRPAVGLYTFDPFGFDLQLFNQPQEALPWTETAESVQLPVAISREILITDLEAYRKAYGTLPPDQQPPNSAYYGPDRSINLIADGANVPPMALGVTNLQDWFAGTAKPPALTAALDPELGRIAWVAKTLPKELSVTYSHGFSGPLGSGTYDRRTDSNRLAVDWHATVGTGGTYPDLETALAAWTRNGSPRAVIRILDNGQYPWSGQVLLPKNALLILEASEQVRPSILVGDSSKIAGPPTGEAVLRLSGLYIEGILNLSAPDSLVLEILDSTLLPPRVAVSVFEPAGNLQDARWGHTATPLQTGDVLIAGGLGSAGSALGSSAIYQLMGRGFEASGGMKVPRYLHSASSTGAQLILVGGLDGNGKPLNSAESFAGGEFELLDATLKQARAAHTSTTLATGQVLIAGGQRGKRPVAVAELYDPATQSFTVLKSRLNQPRWGHTATLLQASGAVLIYGGVDASGPVKAAELYDPQTQTFALVPSSSGTPVFAQAAALCNAANAQALVCGGDSGEAITDQAMVFSAVSGFDSTGNLNVARAGHSASLLGNSQVLIAGGSGETNSGSEALSSAELYDPASGKFTETASLNGPRTAHTATTLSNGRVLVVGGKGSDGSPLAAAELFNLDSWRFQDSPVVSSDTGSKKLHVQVGNSIVGSVFLTAQSAAVTVADSIVDAFATSARPALGGAPSASTLKLSIQRSTIFGDVEATELALASLSLLMGKVSVTNQSAARYSYLPLHAGSAKDFRCQPYLALAEAAAQLGLPSIDDLPPRLKVEIELMMIPVFTSRRFPGAAYGQLTSDTSEAIRAGGPDGDELGVFAQLWTPAHEKRVRQLVQQFLPFGQQSMIVFIN